MKNKHTYLKVIRFLQHVLAAVTAFSIVYLLIGTSVMIEGINGSSSYTLYESDKDRSYEESYLFNNILGNNIADVMRFAAISTQLEKDGKFDEDKNIDVTAYVHRRSSLSSDYVTAVYSLSDLLKWAAKGMDYETYSFSDSDASSFLNSSTSYVHLKDNSYSGGMNTYLNSQIDDNRMKFAISGNSSPEGGNRKVLINSYQTVDGKNVEDLVSRWDEYDLLVSTIAEAADDLQINYEDYLHAKEYYSADNSNLRFYFTRTLDGESESYTNVPELSNKSSEKEAEEYFKSLGKYVYYSPYTMEYSTNTLLDEKMVRSIINSYSYAFPDRTVFYVGVDTPALPVKDSFTQGKEAFTKYMPYRSQMLATAVAGAIIYFVLMVIYLSLVPADVQYPIDKKHSDNDCKLSDSSGKDSDTDEMHSDCGEKPSDESKIKPEKKKNTCTELIIILGLLIMLIPAVGGLLYKMAGLLHVLGYSVLPYLAALAGFVISIGFLYIIYTLAVKHKQKRIWRDSFLRKICLALRNLVINICDNPNVVIRSVIPYAFFLLMNLLLIQIGILGIIVAVAMDVIVGIYLYRQNLDRNKIISVIENIRSGDVKAKMDVSDLHSDNKRLAEAVNSIGDGIDMAVNTSMRDEKLKADLITNVSHDIKTPLTSIINYVGLIKREDIDNPRIKEYVDVLEDKSLKLKQLTEDLLEASKISSGNISIELTRINFVEMVNQTIGEFYEKFENNNLQVVFKPDSSEMYINADARHLWRVLENLLNNVCKYALSGTRVYLDMKFEEEKYVVFCVKNISAVELNIEASELTERFIRGDESRTTEGSGLGLSIAESLTTAQGGIFKIDLDGDLFKVTLKFETA